MYLIDGNNVIGRRMGQDEGQTGARRQLMADVARLAKVKKLRLTIVFDGTPDAQFPDGSRYRGVGIFYARPNSDADTRIVEMAEAERNKKNLIVVTSDGKLTARVRVCGVRVIRSSEFKQLLDEAAEATAINDELRVAKEEVGQWLRYFGVEENGDSDK